MISQGLHYKVNMIYFLSVPISFEVLVPIPDLIVIRTTPYTLDRELYSFSGGYFNVSV